MYLDFYALQKAPFHITPDPEFLFLSPSHKAALGALVYGIAERQGFVALVGEVGLGKTTILRSYLARVDPAQLKTIYMFNANLSFSDLLQTVCRAFQLEVTPDDVFDTLNRLHQVLIEEYNQGRNVALLIDEAQHMPIETLEQLRLLSNLEISAQKLIQIVLVGQPEFAATLNNHPLQQLQQCVVIRATIAPLTEHESLQYIAHRLAKVSLTDTPIFTRGALRQIIKHAKGTPRVLNVLCTNALLQGFGYRQPCITARTVKEVIAYYRGGQRAPWQWRPWLALTGATALLAAWFLFSPSAHRVVSKMDTKGLTTHPLTQVTPSSAAGAAPRLPSPLPLRGQRGTSLTAPLPQETPAAPRDSLLPVAESIPALPLGRALNSRPPVAESSPALPLGRVLNSRPPVAESSPALPLGRVLNTNGSP